VSGRRRIFISSVQKELAAERRALADFIHGDPLLRRFFEVFLFEDLPASGRRADEVYLEEVDRCDVYLGLLGNDYGYEDAEGISPTQREFERATAAGKERLIFVKGDTDSTRHPKMQALVRQVGAQLIRRRFNDTPELTAQVYSSLVEYPRYDQPLQGCWCVCASVSAGGGPIHPDLMAAENVADRPARRASRHQVGTKSAPS